MKILISLLILLYSAGTLADDACAEKTPWKMPPKPAAAADSVSQIDVLVNTYGNFMTTLCYCEGEENSYVNAHAVNIGGKGETTRVYLGGCAVFGGKNLRLNNPNSQPAAGGFELNETKIPPA